MRSIGVRELRQQASRHLRAVRDGETIRITDRGKPVAMIVPVPKQAGLEGLEASGRLTPAKGDLLKVAARRPKKGIPLPSETLRRMRADER